MGKIAAIDYFRVPPRWLFVKITDEQGRVGWGEATLEGHTLAVEGTLDAFKDSLIGMEADNIEHIWQFAWRGGFYRGGPVFMSALSGIDIALWDIKARKLGAPIYQLLGGKVRDKVKVYAWIGGDRPSDVKEQAYTRKRQGFHAIKMNGTADLGYLESPDTVKASALRVAAVREVGLDAAVDFHGRVHRAMAGQLAKALEPHGPLFIEEPLLPEQPPKLVASAVGSRVATPVALGERLYSRHDVRPYLEAGAVDVLQPDVSHVGGISEIMRVAAMAEAYDVAIAPHCPLGPIAFAASLQVDTVIPNFAIQEMPLGIHYNAGSGADLNSYVKNPEALRVVDGYVKVPDGPGIGVEVDEDQVRRMAETHKSEKPWTTPGFIGPGGEIREW